MDHFQTLQFSECRYYLQQKGSSFLPKSCDQINQRSTRVDLKISLKIVGKNFLIL